MIDPTNITNYNLSDAELEEHLLFWICAAGKNGGTAAKCLDKLLKTFSIYSHRPLIAIFMNDYMESLYKHPPLASLLKECGIGCYNQKAKTFKQIARKYVIGTLDLKTCATEELEAVYGIGMKTSRCFILHSRKDARYAGLDTHMLKHLREVGVENVPKATPSSKKLYLTLEKEVLSLADKAGMSPADYDLMVWNFYSATNKNN